MAQEKALGNIIGYRATFAKQVGGTVGRVHKGLQNGYRRLTFFCRKRARLCEADGSVSAEEGGVERPMKKPRLAATGLKIHAWPAISAVPTFSTEPASGVPVGAAPSAAPAPHEAPAAEEAPPAPERPLQTETPAVTYDMPPAPAARPYTHAMGLEYSRRSKEGLAHARQFMSEMRATVDLLLQEDFRSAAEAPNRGSVYGGDSPAPNATLANVPMSVHNLPGSRGGSANPLADLSTPLGGSGVVPQASEQGEPQQRLEHVGGAIAGQEAMPAMEGPADILPYPPLRVQVQPLQPSHLLSPTPSSTPQPTPRSNPQVGPDLAELCQQETVPHSAQSREKSAEAEAAGTAGVQGGSVSQTEGQFDGAAPADSAGDDSISGGDSGDCSVEGVSSGGNKSHSSGAGSGDGRSGQDRSGDEASSGGSHTSRSHGGSDGSHAGSGAAVQSALRLPAVPADGAPPATLPVPESGHGKEIDKASGGGGGAEQGGMVGGGSGGTLGAIQYIPTFSLNPNMMPFDQWLLQYKDIKAGEAAAAKGRRVSGSANCNTKQEAHAFLADLGLHTAVEGEGTAGSRGSQGDHTMGGADAEMPPEANTNVARHMVNAECDDPLPDADMEEDEYDYSYPGAEVEEDWCKTAAPHSTPPDAAPLEAQASVPPTSASPTPTQALSGAAPMAAARPFSRGSQHASLVMLPIPAHTPPPLHAAPTAPDGPVYIARPFSRGRRDAPPVAFAGPPGMAGPIFPPDQHAPMGMPYIPPPPAHTARPFSRGRTHPPPPPPPQAVAPAGSPGVQSSHQPQYQRRKRKHEDNSDSEVQKRRRLPESGGADSAQQWAVSSAWQRHNGLQAAVQAVAGSTAPAGPAASGVASAVASGGAAVAEAAAGSGEGLQSAGLAGAALAGQTATQSGGRFAASSFGSSKVQAAVNGSAAGIHSSYKFSF